MADFGYIQRKLRGLPSEQQRVFLEIFTEVVKNLRFGHPSGEQPDPLVNFGGGFYDGTTASVANTEFSIVHRFGRAPYLALPCLPLDTVGAKIVPLTVTRAADADRIYLSSSVTSAPVTLIVEG